MDTFEIRKLTPALVKDYFDFLITELFLTVRRSPHVIAMPLI